MLVRFINRSAPYFPGDVADFATPVAEKLIRKRAAVPAEVDAQDEHAIATPDEVATVSAEVAVVVPETRRRRK
jgi:hypothetical protein